MGGYVEQSRVVPHQEWSFSTSLNGALWAGGVTNRFSNANFDGMAQEQTTYSYRTGGPESLDDIYFRGGTLGSSTQAIRTRDRERGTTFDNGHEFDTLKRVVTQISHPHVAVSGHLSQGHLVEYEGPLLLWHNLIASPNPTYGTITYPTDLNFWGTKAIASVRPGDSAADVAQALIELKREGLPRLFGAASIRNRARLARSAGEEYLNYEFGWRPLVRDVHETASAAARSEQILRDYTQRSGTVIHRRWSSEPETTTTFNQYSGLSTLRAYPLSTNTMNNNIVVNAQNVRYSVLTTTTVKRSFSGAFTYYAPPSLSEMSGIAGAIRRANYLYGLELTPELLWEVAPWSWLVDWFGNVGEVLSNVTALQIDGTVMRFGYVMSHTTIERTVVAQGVTFQSGSVGTVSCTYRTERKSRERATPYGFGLNPGSFTGRQWAILGSLGLTRGNNTLRHSD